MTAFFLRNMCAKNYRTMYVKIITSQRWDVFCETSNTPQASLVSSMSISIVLFTLRSRHVTTLVAVAHTQQLP